MREGRDLTYRVSAARPAWWPDARAARRVLRTR